MLSQIENILLQLLQKRLVQSNRFCDKELLERKRRLLRFECLFVSQ